jgi:carboxyl-terminal processing protease
LLLSVYAQSQSLESKANDAFLITRMVEKFHVQPRALDKTMSAAIYAQMLKSLDEQRLFFTRADIAQLSAFQYSLDEEIKGRKTGFLQLLTVLYQQRLKETDSMIEYLTQKHFGFTAKEVLTVAEDSSFPIDLNARREKIYKLLKWSIATDLAETIVAQESKGNVGGKSRQQLIDILEPKLRKRSMLSTRRTIKRLLQSPTGIGNMIGITYCEALAECYDPHTSYFSPDQKADFEIEIGNLPLSYGLTLKEDEEGNAMVGHLLPGGPAFESGAINEGDKILSVRWEGKEPIDLTDATAEEVYRLLSTEGGDRLMLSVKKSDGTMREVSLHKQRITSLAEEDQDKVKGFLLKGKNTIGYISLPAFYSDWEDNRGVNGCANDVAKEVLKLKKEHITGLILDLRYNGGGSVDEAVQLSGLFIDAGPVGQVVSRDPKVFTLKDVNRGMAWDGPLLVLVNGSSASASEMVAGTLQDYNRALIVGSPTYGKATMQVVLPIDTSIDLDHFDSKKQASSYLKFTISKLYRVTGMTVQKSGVQPDILLPEPPEADAEREADEPFALPPAPIAANKYYQPMPSLPIAQERAIAAQAMSRMDYFKAVASLETIGREKKVIKDKPLNLDELIAEAREAKNSDDGKEEEDQNELFTVSNPVYENQLLQSDAMLKEMNEERKKEVLYDPYLKVAFQLVVALIK